MVTKIPLVFECEGQKLVGILTCPVNSQKTIKSVLITLPAGGPQYRVGLARGLVKQAEYYATKGLATLRFDYRGIGDSDGEFQGFDSVVPDLESAIAAVKAELPELDSVVLSGGCNAASAIMMHAWRFPMVKAIIVNNPYLGKHNLADKAKLFHFYNRIKQKSFWVKLFSGQYDIKSYFSRSSKASKTQDRKIDKNVAKPNSQPNNSSLLRASSSANNQPGFIIEQMLKGMKSYRGNCLMFLSENSIQSNEFRVLLKTSRQWKKLFKRKNTNIMSLANADQNISSVKSQEKVREMAGSWLKSSSLI